MLSILHLSGITFLKTRFRAVLKTLIFGKSLSILLHKIGFNTPPSIVVLWLNSTFVCCGDRPYTMRVGR